MDLKNFISKLKALVKDSQLNDDELFLLSSDFFKSDNELYELVFFFANDSDIATNLPNGIKTKDIARVKKACTSLLRKLENKELSYE